MPSHEAEFWQETDRYHDLARDIDRRFTITHPDYVTSNGIGVEFLNYDVWSATAVTYYELR